MKLLEDAINGISLNLEAHDYWTWKLESSGTFSTSFEYSALIDINFPCNENPLLEKIWHLDVPPKVSFLPGHLLLNRLPTVDNLKR